MYVFKTPSSLGITFEGGQRVLVIDDRTCTCLFCRLLDPKTCIRLFGSIAKLDCQHSVDTHTYTHTQLAMGALLAQRWTASSEPLLSPQAAMSQF